MKKLGLIMSVMLLVLTLTVPVSFAWKETEISKSVPLPPRTQIVPPAADLPKDIAAWSGRWEGIWEESNVMVILIVEEITAKKMKVIYATGPSQRNIRGQYSRLNAKVVAGGKKIEIYFPGSYPLTIVFEMGEDCRSVRGCGTVSGYTETWNTKMEKIED